MLTKIYPIPVSLSKKAGYNTKLAEIENAVDIPNEMSGITNLGHKNTLSTKATEVNIKTPDITNLAIKTAFKEKDTKIKNKILDITKLEN